MSTKSRRKGWSVTVTADGRDMGHYRDVRAVEPWTAVYHVLRYGVAQNYSLREIDGMTITVKPDPTPPAAAVQPRERDNPPVAGGTDTPAAAVGRAVGEALEQLYPWGYRSEDDEP